MSPQDRPNVFPSAIDPWLVVLVFLGPFTATGLGIYAVMTERHSDASMFFVLGAICTALPLLFMLPCRYTILQDSVSIRCGLRFRQIELSDIQDVSLCKSWQQGPALSLRRVEIKTAGRSILISPNDREGFVEALTAARASVLADQTELSS